MHPIQSPQNRFCVLTLDPETLPAIATTLIDVLFYSHRWASFVLSLILTLLFPMACPTTFYLSLGSATLRPVLCPGFPAACDAHMPFTEVQEKSQCCSWSPLLECGQSHPQAMTWSGPLALGFCVFSTGSIHCPSPPSLPSAIRKSGPSDREGKWPRDRRPVLLLPDWEEMEWAGCLWST